MGQQNLVKDLLHLQICQGCHQLRLLRLSQCKKVTDFGVKAIAENCPEMRTLILDQCTQVWPAHSIGYMLCTPECQPCIPWLAFLLDTDWLLMQLNALFLRYLMPPSRPWCLAVHIWRPWAAWVVVWVLRGCSPSPRFAALLNFKQMHVHPNTCSLSSPQKRPVEYYQYEPPCSSLYYSINLGSTLLFYILLL